MSALPRNTLSEWVTDRSGAGAVAWGCPLILGHLKRACIQRELTDLDTLSKACAKFGFRSPSGAIVSTAYTRYTESSYKMISYHLPSPSPLAGLTLLNVIIVKGFVLRIRGTVTGV